MQENGVLFAKFISCLGNSEIIKGESPVQDWISCIWTDISNTQHLNCAIFEESPINVLFFIKVVYFVGINSSLSLADWYDCVACQMPED
jgi:hypothetical protein